MSKSRLTHARQHDVAQTLGLRRLWVGRIVFEGGRGQLLGTFRFHGPMRDQRASRAGVEESSYKATQGFFDLAVRSRGIAGAQG